MTDITTTDGKTFTMVESVDLARLIYHRFGCDLKAATAAWCRLLENNTTESEFDDLVSYGEHTPNCKGECQSFPE